MTYKETLFFVGKCLTINHEKHNYDSVEKLLKDNTIDWDAVVKLSTAHYVFPALYSNLKKANFLSYLPSDLVDYMKHITDLNRERNHQIIAQAKEINEVLLSNNINPIFLKGTGNLLEGLYEDIAERMVGDIDFLVKSENAEKAQEILLKNGYKGVLEGPYIKNRHYKRLHSDSQIAAIEVHKEVTSGEYKKTFSNSKVMKKIHEKRFLCLDNQLCLSIIAHQINDYGHLKQSFSLRNCYDVFLLSNKVDSLQSIKQYPKLFIILNNYLTLTKVIFNSKVIKFENNKKSKKYINGILKNFEKDNKTRRSLIEFYLFSKQRLSIVFKSFYNKENRNWLFYRIKNKDWQQQKLIQLGLKKAKPKS